MMCYDAEPVCAKVHGKKEARLVGVSGVHGWGSEKKFGLHSERKQAPSHSPKSD